MRGILLYILPIAIILSIAKPSHAQFWKKKKYHTEASSGKVTKPDAGEFRDAFSRKSSKGANIKTKNKPFFLFRSKKKMKTFSTSRKTKKPGSKSFFKPKYSSVKLKKKSRDNFSRNTRKVKKDAQRGGGGGNGIFKGRKK